MSTTGLTDRFGSLTAADVAALDAAALAAGVEILQLMEVAGLQVARGAWRHLGERPGRVRVAAGRGNNGGDGLVAARHLDAWGCDVGCVIIAEDESRVRGPVATQLAALRGSDASVMATIDMKRLRTLMEPADLAIDALLGTGLRDAPRGADAEAIELLNAGDAAVLAVDVPSGLDATTGATPGACVRAALTVTLTAMKAGLWTARGQEQAGEVLVGDIGMPSAAWRRAGLRRPTAVVGGGLLSVPATTP